MPPQERKPGEGSPKSISKPIRKRNPFGLALICASRADALSQFVPFGLGIATVSPSQSERRTLKKVVVCYTKTSLLYVREGSHSSSGGEGPQVRIHLDVGRSDTARFCGCGPFLGFPVSAYRSQLLFARPRRIR
jgi:hypothetical protein